MIAVGAGVAVGEGNSLRVADDPEVDLAGMVFGTVPEVDAVGEEGVVLGIDEDEDEDEDIYIILFIIYLNINC